MGRGSRAIPLVSNQDDRESDPSPGSPSSDDELKMTSGEPSPKKRKSAKKRVVAVPFTASDVEGWKSKGDQSYPPYDSWAWRKYGQKPIKGSPYPRGYYRCSSSKGCPARKQVERSRVDPATLLVTYSYEHNHPLPSPAKHHHHHRSSCAADSDSVKRDPDQHSSPPLVGASELDLDGDPDTLLDPEFYWLADVASTSTFSRKPIYAGSGDMESGSSMMREEDESLFGDLGELPECSLVFQRSEVVGNAG